MRSPLEQGRWVVLDTAISTQDVAAEFLARGQDVGVVMVLEQTGGRGRLGRDWLAEKGASLTFSLIFHSYSDHPRPYLIGMAVAVAAARRLGAQVSWPNDLYLEGKKLGGILTELYPDPMGHSIPVVGIGVNLNQHSFPPEIAGHATSLHLARGGVYEPEAIGQEVIEAFSHLPDLNSWADLEPEWMPLDATPGKQFRLASGEIAIAERVGEEGELVCRAKGIEHRVLAAEAITSTQ